MTTIALSLPKATQKDTEQLRKYKINFDGCLSEIAVNSFKEISDLVKKAEKGKAETIKRYAKSFVEENPFSDITSLESRILLFANVPTKIYHMGPEPTQCAYEDEIYEKFSDPEILAKNKGELFLIERDPNVTGVIHLLEDLGLVKSITVGRDMCKSGTDVVQPTDLGKAVGELLKENAKSLAQARK